ncbi:hypothetical protein CLF_105422 [Clonorchis sinensis]|uniref:Uncharacterized protein n=1 Tax=Clonorchis sinensis TaxID=79923 RepID=G7YPA8_CLOSI|nr:hypothetical protein CLF_105422 [Clonorchis sinensis]
MQDVVALKHSQKLALAFGTLAVGIAYGCQPYYEVCCRWSLVQHKANGETRPSDRILRAFDEVCCCCFALISLPSVRFVESLP